MAKERLLLLGANGKLGRMVGRAMQQIGTHQIIGIARDGSSDVIWAPGASGKDLPHADTVVALWGVTPGPGRDLSQNATLARAALDVAIQTKAIHVLHCSSAAVYGAGDLLHTEEDPLTGTSPYAKAKIEMERQISETRSKTPEVQQTILRIGNVVGADSLGPAMRDNAVVLDRFPDGSTPVRSYIAPGDMARGMLKMLGQTCPPIMNFAAPVPIEMEDLARAAGANPQYRTAPPGALPRAVLDPTLMLKTVGPVFECTTPDQMIADWQKWNTL